MKNISVFALRKLCVKGIISTNDYWKYKKLKSHRVRSKIMRCTKNKFNLNTYSDDETKLLFRFTKHEINRLMRALNIPNMCSLPKGTKFSGAEAICILLRRLSYPNRLVDLVKMFGRDPTTLSRMFNWILKRIFVNHGKLVQSLKQPWLTDYELENLAQSCIAAGSYYSNIIGFIDGTARSISRPKYNQKHQYSGYKKHHVMKYQAIVFPNGLIGRLDGPFNCRRHDSAVLDISRLRIKMQKFLVKNNRSYAVYGDPGYSNQKFIKVGFKNYDGLTARQKTFNSEMSTLRVSVEYGFGKIIQKFAFLDFKKNKKLLKSFENSISCTCYFNYLPN